MGKQFNDGSEGVVITDGAGGTGSVKIAANTAAIGSVIAAGDVAAGATDSGNPVKVGAKYSVTQPTLADLQRGDLQLGSRGSLSVQILGKDGTSGASVIASADTLANGNGLTANTQTGVYNGTTWDRLRGYAVNVDGTTSPTLGLAGTAAFGLVYNGTTWDRIQSARQALNATLGVQAAGMVGLFDDVSPQTITENSMGVVRMTANHAVLVKPYASDAETWTYAAASGGLVNNTGVTVKASAGGSIRNYVTGLDLSWGTLSGTTEVLINDGASGTVLWRGFCPTVAGSRSITFPVPLRGTAATLVEIKLVTSVTGGVYMNLTGYSAL
jgi:hypothetical protein